MARKENSSGDEEDDRVRGRADEMEDASREEDFDDSEDVDEDDDVEDREGSF